MLVGGEAGLRRPTIQTSPARYLEWDDIVTSEVKAGVFGFFIALMESYRGYHTRGGAAGVGRATSQYGGFRASS